MKVYHISAECYPVAKTGGLGDVVGALPKYQTLAGLQTAVVMPWYDKPFMKEHAFNEVYAGEIKQGSQFYSFQVLKEQQNVLGFELYVIKIPGLLDRPEVYGYADENNQFIAFQHVFLTWLTQQKIRPDIIHCHDHHAGLIPFFMENCVEFSFLSGIPTVGTVHNGQYQGWMDWHKGLLMPLFNTANWGLLDWDHCINSLAALIKCCWAYTTVSEGYLQELYEQANGLERLFLAEKNKSYGILNGIDSAVWDPGTDELIHSNFTVSSLAMGKKKNKQALCRSYKLNNKLPLLVYIGRFALEKGADLLPGITQQLLSVYEGKLNVIVLGSGDIGIQDAMTKLSKHYPKQLAVIIGYKETLSHQLYASADFLIMPSRVEPCGLNQLYAMRYGTIPIVRATGGLKDTVRDITMEDPNGFLFTNPSVPDAVRAVQDALAFYEDSAAVNELRRYNMTLDYSWKSSAEKYSAVYQSLIRKI